MWEACSCLKGLRTRTKCWPAPRTREERSCLRCMAFTRYCAWIERCNPQGQNTMKNAHRGINPASKPSGDGCVECLASPKGWWFHLRRCAECGHIGCCDSSPGQHASKHAAATGHPIITSFEPGEDWFFDYETQGIVRGLELGPPHAHPASQPTPGPAGGVPDDWESLLHSDA